MIEFVFAPQPVIAFFLLLAGIATFIIGLTVLIKSKRNPVHTIFFFFCFFLSWWTLSLSAASSGISPELMVLGACGAVLGGLPIPFFLLLFSNVFPSGEMRFSKLQIFLLAIPSIILLISFPGKLLVNAIVQYGYIILRLGPVNNLYTLHFIAYFCWGGIILYQKYKRSNKIEQIRYKYFLAGFFITSIVGVTGNVVLLSIFKLSSFVYFSPLATFFLVISTAYAILKYRLMDISLVVKKTTAYSLITTAITFIYVLVVLLFESAYRHIYGSYSFMASIPAALVIAVTFIPLRASLQKVTDQIFFRRTIEYQNVIKEVSRLIVSVTDLKTLFRLIDRTIVRAMCVKNVAVLLLEESKQQFMVEKTNGLPQEVLDIKLPPDTPLAVYLNERKDAIVYDEIKALLESALVATPEKEKLKQVCSTLENLGASVAIPSFAKKNLVGILCLGEKLSGETYSPEDLELLFAMASEAGIAIENAQLYRDITETRDYLNNLVQGSNDAIITMDLVGKVLSWNTGAESIFGYSSTETIGNIPLIFSEDELKQYIKTIVRGKKIKAVELRKKNKTGKEVPLILTLSPIRDTSNHIMGISAILKDISELKKVEQLKHEFLSVVSHELRTPLTPIKGYLSLFLNGQLGKLTDQQIEALKTIANQSSHLLDLIDSIIDISRIEAGKSLILKKEPLFLEDIINESLKHCAHNFELKEITVKTNLLPVRSALMADKNKLSRVIDSLLTNAQKFTPFKGDVTISVEKTDHHIGITVADSGIGLAKEQLQKIFERFYQVDSSYTRASGGIGMGLTVAKEIIKAHDGNIKAESEGLGRGSKFHFTLPLI